MPSPHLELRQLAGFVLACQKPTIGEAARALGVSSSTLSVSLRNLEEALNLKLFRRQGPWLAPLPAAFWLFQQATAVLRSEALALNAARGVRPRAQVHVRVDLSFNIGRLSKALGRTVEAMRETAPEVAFDFEFAALQAPEQAALATCGTEPDLSRIEISYRPRGSDETCDLLLSDDWITVTQTDQHEEHGVPPPLTVLRLRQPLLDAIRSHAARHGLSDRVGYSPARPRDLGDLLAENPTRMFLLPRSLISNRLGFGQLRIAPLGPALFSDLNARIEGNSDGAAQAFVQRLRQELAEPESDAVFRPVLTARQIVYFNMIHRCGSIAAAARALNVSQPTVSQQIQRMETAVAQPLLTRASGGKPNTTAGALLAPCTMALERRLNAMVAGALDTAAHTQQAVTIGILPSSGHDSEMTTNIARALCAVQQAFPGCRLRVVQASNANLHAAVKADKINLGVVTNAQGHFPRVQLGLTEPLCIVANPHLGLSGQKTISLGDAVQLPLILAPEDLSIHAVFRDAAAGLRMAVNTVIEVGSLPLVIALARLSAVATVLPASSVRADIEAGRLTATLITELLGSGSLSVIFSGERTLSDIERGVIRALSDEFLPRKP